MPYIKDTLISRPAAKPLQGVLGSFLDTIESIGKGALTFYGDQQKQAGALDALKAQQPVPAAASSGVDTTTILLGGAVVVGAVLLLTRKKKG